MYFWVKYIFELIKFCHPLFIHCLFLYFYPTEEEHHIAQVKVEPPKFFLRKIFLFCDILQCKIIRFFFLQVIALIPWSPQKDPYWVGELHEIVFCMLFVNRIESLSQNTSWMKSKDLERLSFPLWIAWISACIHIIHSSQTLIPTWILQSALSMEHVCIWHKSCEIDLVWYLLPRINKKCTRLGPFIIDRSVLQQRKAQRSQTLFMKYMHQTKGSSRCE